MSEFTPINPKPFLRDLVNQPVIITLKFNNTQYRGVLVSTDNYFNIQLKDAEEWVNNESRGVVGEIFIRCNNVLWISQDQTKK
ncbi:small nuclear ribonucleoprotein F [Monosporozyma unispora]